MPSPTTLQNVPAHLPGAGQMVWRDKLSQLLESTGEGIFGIDMFGCCTFINRAAKPQGSTLARGLISRAITVRALCAHTGCLA